MSCGCGCGGEVVAYEDWGEHNEEENATAAEYQGRSVTLNKPFRTPGANKKFGVYTKNESGNVVLVRFGDPNMEIKRDDPKRRKAFRDRHNCDNPGPKYKARYWSCRQWRGGKKVEAEEGCGCNMDIDVEAEEEFDLWLHFEAEECECEYGCDCGLPCCSQVGIASKHDARSTPAPPKDRKKGSKKNKPGSARPGGKVTFSEGVTNSLKTKVKEHNAKSDRKVTLGMLKAVYRRGAGAYSTSHRPGVSRAAWSMARVNAFLKLVRSGKPSNPKYVQDNDLLPGSHPRKSKKASMDYCDACADTAACAKHGSCMQAEANMMRKMKVYGEKDVFDNPGEAMERAKEMGCDEIHSHKEDGKTIFMPCKSHGEYNKKMGGKMEVEGYKHKEEEASYHDGDSCDPGYEKVNGECKRVAVTIDLDDYDLEATVEASTGETVIKITGIAFHEGLNKNKWEITKAGAEKVAGRMVGADVTLNHPPANDKGRGFTRNMDGDVKDATVGYVSEAKFEDLGDGKWNVRYVAYVVRNELFNSLESGLWSREEYGVSIGGSGVPVSATEDGITFGDDFTFDHLAIVHRPAYPRANIESVERVEKSKASQTFISHSIPHANQQTQEVIEMTAEEIVETSADEMESLKAELVMANARVAEFEAAEHERVEAERVALVEKATEIGMSGHEDLKTETLETLIASWEASHPEPAPVEMASVEDTPAVESPVVASESAPTSVVANYLNGELVETEESLYERAYNAWARAWNGTLDASESNVRASMYSEIKEMI